MADGTAGAAGVGRRENGGRRRAARRAAGDAANGASPLFMDFVGEEYLPHLRRTVPAGAAWRDAARAQALIWEFGGLTLDAITPEAVAAGRDAWGARTPAPVANLYLALLARILSRAVACGLLPRNPAAAVPFLGAGAQAAAAGGAE